MARRTDVTKVSFRVSIDEKNELARFAESQDLTVSQVVRRAVKRFLVEESQKQEENVD